MSAIGICWGGVLDIPSLKALSACHLLRHGESCSHTLSSQKGKHGGLLGDGFFPEFGRGTAAVADGLMAFLVYWNGRRHILFTGEAGIFLSTAPPFCHKFDQDLGGISCPICPTAL